MTRGKVDRLLERARAALAALPPTAEEQAGEALQALAALAAFAFGEQDQRGNVEYLRTLDRGSRLDVYRVAMETAAQLWQGTEEGQRFKALPFDEQCQVCLAATRAGDNILAIHGMRLVMRELKWKEWYKREPQGQGR